MKVRRLNESGDWTFGNGKANYVKDNDAILQNVATRIKSFKNDWFLDSELNIDWFSLLSDRSDKQSIISEVNRVALETEGVLRINTIELTEKKERNAELSINLDTIYIKENKIGLNI